MHNRKLPPDDILIPLLKEGRDKYVLSTYGGHPSNLNRRKLLRDAGIDIPASLRVYPKSMSDDRFIKLVNANTPVKTIAKESKLTVKSVYVRRSNLRKKGLIKPLLIKANEVWYQDLPTEYGRTRSWFDAHRKELRSRKVGLRVAVRRADVERIVNANIQFREDAAERRTSATIAKMRRDTAKELPRDHVSISEAMREINMSRERIRQLMNDGYIRAYVYYAGPGGRQKWCIHKDEIERLKMTFVPPESLVTELVNATNVKRKHVRAILTAYKCSTIERVAFIPKRIWIRGTSIPKVVKIAFVMAARRHIMKMAGVPDDAKTPEYWDASLVRRTLGIEEPEPAKEPPCVTSLDTRLQPYDPHLNLTTRSVNCLANEGILTVGDLSKLNDWDEHDLNWFLTCTRNLGKCSAHNIREALAQLKGTHNA